MIDTKKDIMVSVCMITYKHEDFIKQAIEGVLMQKTTFQIELVIGEDCGPDLTREICIAYKKKYPNIIRLNLPEKNLGAQQNFISTYNLCIGKYIALCEGDDYWIDENKLQKQVDFMEEKPDFSLCSHASYVLMCGNLDEYNSEKTEYTIDDIIAGKFYFITASFLFRRDCFIIPDWFYKVKHGDYALELIVSLKGKIGYLPDNYMSVYRRHLGGITTLMKPFFQTRWLIYLFFEFDRFTNYTYKKQILKRIKSLYKEQIHLAWIYSFRKDTLILLFFQQFRRISPFLIKKLCK